MPRNNGHSTPAVETLRAIVGERRARMRTVAIAVHDDEAGPFGVTFLSLHRLLVHRRERLFESALKCVERR